VRALSRLDGRCYGGNRNGTKWHHPTYSCLMSVPQVAKLVALLHNCTRGGQVLEAVLETAVRRGADVVLIQEPKGA